MADGWVRASPPPDLYPEITADVRACWRGQGVKVETWPFVATGWVVGYKLAVARGRAYYEDFAPANPSETLAGRMDASIANGLRRLESEGADG